MKLRYGLLLLAVASVSVLIRAQQNPAPAPPTQGAPGQAPAGRGRGGRPAGRKVVLAWADTRNGVAQHDSVSHALAVVERLGYESGLWDTYIRTDSNIASYRPLQTTGQPASGGPSFNNVDAIFFMGHREVPIDDQQRADLLKFVHDDGKGFVAAHVALTALMAWPEFGEMLGGQFQDHPYGSVAGSVINEDPSFPATKHLPATFDLTDEFYQPKNFSREKSRVLLRLDTSKLPPNQNLLSKDGDFPLAWAKMYGQGRVFFGSFAHDTKTWDDPRIATMYFEAIKWALKLTDADVTPRPLPAAAKPAGK
jgi:uncharacterized protein